MKLREKIESRLDDLTLMMMNGDHLIDAPKVIIQTESISKFWPVLTEEERDFIHGVRFCIEEKLEWK